VTAPSKSITRALRARLGAAGLDLLAPLQVGWYNRRVEQAHALDELGHPGNLALVVGNTRALWEPFVAALARDPVLLAEPHPLERYVVAEVDRAVEALGLRAHVRYAHQPPPRLMSVQHLALAAGLAARSPVQLCAHPVHGTWFGLRAAVVVEKARGPQQSPPDPGPCGDCPATCVAPFEHALQGLGGVERYNDTVERPDSEAYHRWVAFRDACPVGRTSRYSEQRIRYHYTRDRQVLRAEVERVRAQSAVTVLGLREVHAFDEIPGCPGRAVVRGGPSALSPAQLAGAAARVRGFVSDAAADAVLVARLEGGGLISYLRPNGTYVHTLNNEEGFQRKLAGLGVKFEDPIAKSE